MPQILGCAQAQHSVNAPSEYLSDELYPFSHVPPTTENQANRS